jgi:hypothetical protein
MIPPLFLAPPEILEEIVLMIVADDPIGPPSSLYALQLTSHYMHRSLRPSANPRLYARIYMQMFGDARRMQELRKVLEPSYEVAPLSRSFADELQSRLRVMQIFRDVAASMNIGLYDPRLPEVFVYAYVMLRMDPSSVVQLRWARAYEVCLAWLRLRLYEGASENHGWPLETDSNALVVSLFWMLSSEGESAQNTRYMTAQELILVIDAVRAESGSLRAEIMQLLHPFVHASFRVRAI